MKILFIALFLVSCVTPQPPVCPLPPPSSGPRFIEEIGPTETNQNCNCNKFYCQCGSAMTTESRGGTGIGFSKPGYTPLGAQFVPGRRSEPRHGLDGAKIIYGPDLPRDDHKPRVVHPFEPKANGGVLIGTVDKSQTQGLAQPLGASAEK